MRMKSPAISYNPIFLLPCLLYLLSGIGILYYHGPGWHFARAHLGDVVVVAFLYFAVSLFWTASVYWRALAIGLLACSIEFLQLLHLAKHSSFLWQLLLGSSFDILDLLAYGLG